MAPHRPGPRRVLFFGTYDERTHPRVRVLRQGLESSGLVVDVVNRPLGLSTADRVSFLRHPARLPRLALRLLAAWRFLVAASRRLAERPDAVVVGYLGHFDVLLARLLFRRSEILLDYLVSAADTAVDRGIAPRGRLFSLRCLDRAATRAATTVLIDTPENLTTVPAASQHKALVVSVGASREWFRVDREPPGDVLRVVFFGLFTPLQGAVVMARAVNELLARRNDVRVTIVGTGQDANEVRAELAGQEGIHFIDWVDADELPALVARHDICLGIFGSSSKAARVVPNKVFQGAAAGCHVVTSDTPPQRRSLHPSTSLVRMGDPRALALTLEQLADNRKHVAQSGKAQGAHAAREFTPEAVVTPIIEMLQRKDRGETG